MTKHRLPDWVLEGLSDLTINRQLPKWPILQVAGQDVSPELGREICLRTTNLGELFLGVNERGRAVAGALGTTLDDGGFPPGDEHERIEGELGLLQLIYLGNDRVSSSRSTLLSGWCDWDGRIGTQGAYLGDKWASLDRLNEELELIAGTWPQLWMTVQLSSYKDPECYDEYWPFVTWLVGDGSVELLETPGFRLWPVRMPEPDEGRYPTESEQLVDIGTLRRAIKEAKEKNR